MMQILLDTNVILDVLLKREPWVAEASALWKAHDEGRITGYIVASSVTNIFYIARRLAGLNSAREAVRICLDAFEICAVDRQALEQAQALPGSDFEDNLQIACATLAGLDALVSRNKEDFKAATIPVLTPGELLAQMR